MCKNLSQVTAVILVGGLGTRLRPVVTDRPKVLALVHGRPFLSYLFDQLAGAGVRDVILCTGYRADQVKAEFGAAYGALRLTYSPETEPLGTGGALRLAWPYLNSDPVLVFNGDSFCRADLTAFYIRHSAQNAMGTLLLTQVPDTARYGRVLVDDVGQILSFEEKGAMEGPGWISVGIYLLQQPLLQSIPADRPVSLEREIFPAWIKRGLYGYRGDGPFLDIGTPESYRQAEEFFLKQAKLT